MQKGSRGREDRSAFARLLYDFGLLLIKDDFDRHLNEQSRLKQAGRIGQLEDHVPLDEQHLMKFVPLLELLGIEELSRDPHLRYIKELERLSLIEAFLRALTQTVDFSLRLSELSKNLQRKFKGYPNALTLPYKTKRLISADLAAHCRDVMWIVNEFHVDEDDDPWDVEPALWDVNIWTAILDADRLHREQGRVHSAFANYIQQYQARKGDGRPRVYVRTALTVLLAECFEDFDQKKRRPRIYDRSEGADKDQYGRTLTHRKAKYDFAFAKFLVKFVEITDILDAPVHHLDNSLDQFKTIADLRLRVETPCLTKHLKTSLRGRQMSKIIDILEELKF